MNKPKPPVFIVKRAWDQNKKVKVYRNLHKNMWSVKQGKYVVAHADRLYLKDVEFVVSAAGRDRVRREKKKNVHAYVVGYICNCADIREHENSILDGEDDCFDYGVAYYNPYDCDTFVERDSGLEIKTADYCDMDINAISEEGKVLAIWAKPEFKEREYDKI